MIRKLPALLLMMIVAFSLTACGGNQSSSKSNNQKTTQSGKSSQSAKKSQSSAKSSQSAKGSQSGNQAAPKTKGLVSKDKIVAVVNGKKIKGAQYNSVLQELELQYQQQGQNPSSKKVYKQEKKQALDTLVGQVLLLQDANKKGYQPSDQKVTQQLGQVEKQYGGKTKFKKALDQHHMTMDQYKETISKQLELNTYINKQAPVKVTDKEIKAFYNQYKSSTKKPQKLAAIKSSIKQAIQNQKQQPKIAKIVEQLKKKGDVKIKI